MRWCLVVLGAIALGLNPAYAQTEPSAAELFGRLPAISDAAISPDGTNVALAVSNADGASAIQIVNLDGARPTAGARQEGAVQLRAVDWADNGRVVYLLSQTVRPGQVLPPNVRFIGAPTRVDYYRWGTFDLSTGDMQLLTTDEDTPWADQGSQLVVPIEGDDGHARMIGRAPGLQTRHVSLFRVNLNNGRVRNTPPQGTNRDTIGFELDERGEPFIRYDSDERTNRWRLFVYDGEMPRLLTEGVSEYGLPPSVEGMLPDGRLILRERTDEQRTLFVLDRTTGERSVFFERPGVDLNGAIVDPWTRRVVGVSWTSDETEVYFFEPELQAVSERIGAIFEGAFAHIRSWSRDRSRFLLYVESGLDGGGYYIFDRDNERVRLVGRRYPDIERFDGVRQSITYRARDGVRVPAYFSLPADGAQRGLPLVVLVHGGPHARDTMDFDWWAGFLSARGYAVLQPNFRGSSGYGRAWLEAGYRQWGGLMQTDVEDGVVALVRAGAVDPSRVCIVGASYGGYAALAGATLTPDRYRCAASIAGVSDLETMLRVEARQTGGRFSMTSDYWRMSIGDRQEDRDRIRSVSPANLADRVQIPILLVHGTDDTVVPIEQSRIMDRRLRAAGRDVRFVELRGDDHWLSDAATRIQMLRELDAFLAPHLQSGAPSVQ